MSSSISFSPKDMDCGLENIAKQELRLVIQITSSNERENISLVTCKKILKNLLVTCKKIFEDLLTRYKGKFRHYDVNNEMLHGSFYQDRLGSDARANMFKMVHELDPLATLFLNEYHIEDGYDSRSSPEKYIKLVQELREKGAPVGGIAVQGHIASPVGHIVRYALDKLSTLKLPIWFTEIDVSSINEHIRGDDLEVMLWEAFAHPAVEGVLLWGFLELFMSREHSHLVNADGEVNEAGKRFLEIKREWLTFVDGVIDDEGGLKFRGYHGSYTVEVVTSENN